MDKTLIIAEAGVNHNGDRARAIELVDVAAEAGADIVKFQSFRADKLASAAAPKAEYQIRNEGGGESQYEMLKRLELPEEDHEILIARCKARGIQFLSTPFDIDSMHMLVNRFKLDLLKLGSGELTNAPLLLATGKAGKKLILSTGMGTLQEVEEALGVLALGYSGRQDKPSTAAFRAAFKDPAARTILQEKVMLLHCTTEYPTPFEDVNLRAMDTLRDAFGLTVGYSDHTMGIAVSIGAVACGATIIEKHFTLDRNLPGPDHKASVEPDELKAMIDAIREVEKARGTGLKAPAESERKNIAIARKSLVAARDIAAGEIYSNDNVTIKRPGNGRSPYELWDIIGQAAPAAVKKDDLIQ
jgi:N-acetylneuraminate synthase